MTARLWCVMAVCAALLSGAARAEPLRLGWLSLQPAEDSFRPAVDGPRPGDEGRAGLDLAVADNNSSGKFLKHSYAVEAATLPQDGDAEVALARMVAAGIRFVVADLPAPVLARLAASPKAEGVTLFNAGAPDDELRNGMCRRNLLHTLPSRAMQADALAQFLVRKNWKKWLLVIGPDEGDQAFAAAIRRAAGRFGAKVVAEKPWTFTHDARRTAEGEIAIFTQNLSYDVAVVADEAGEWGDLFLFNTWDPRPVAGTQGLVATAWHPAHEQWGAIQLQNRFRAAKGRPMSAKDHAAWQAGRAVGEAALRTNSTDPAKVTQSLRAEGFVFAAFKGRSLSFRPWDGQLRQPLLLASPRAIASVAPQDGFLHPITELDTLGHDKGESKCVPR